MHSTDEEADGMTRVHLGTPPDLEEFSPVPQALNTSDLLAPVLRPPTPSLTLPQVLYLLIACSLVPALVALLINYAVGIVVFWHSENVSIWEGCPQCFGADVLIVITLQAFFGWVFQGAIVMRDCRVGIPGIGVVPQLRGEAIDNEILNNFLIIVDLFRIEGPKSVLWQVRGEWKVHVRRLLFASRNAILYAIVCCVTLAPPTLFLLSLLPTPTTTKEAAEYKAIYSSLLNAIQCLPIGYLALSSNPRAPSLHDSFREGVYREEDERDIKESQNAFSIAMTPLHSDEELESMTIDRPSVKRVTWEDDVMPEEGQSGKGERERREWEEGSGRVEM